MFLWEACARRAHSPTPRVEVFDALPFTGAAHKFKMTKVMAMDLQKADSIETTSDEGHKPEDGALYTEEFFRSQFLARKVAQRLPLQATNWSSAPMLEKIQKATGDPSQLTRSSSAQCLPPVGRGPSAYEQALNDLDNDLNVQKEVALGKRIGFYRLGKELGAGNFSKVRLGVHVLTKEKVAVKIMDKSKMDQKAQTLLAREIETMELTHHPNIIRLFECVETISRTYLIQEYAGGGELYNYVHEQGKLSEPIAKTLFAQVVSAVSHLHSKGIVHRDIKAENVIFTQQGWVKLADFGFSCIVPADAFLHTFCGSPPYAAPELFCDEKYDGPMVDVWALGVLLYFMLVGVTPFRGETVAELKRAVLAADFALPDYVSAGAAALVGALLARRAAQRPSVGGVRAAPWLRDVRFSASYLQLRVGPDERQLETSPLERRVWHTLHQLGIERDMIRAAADKGARNPIIGVYRIVLYQQQAPDRDKERQKINGHLLELAEKNRVMYERMNKPSKTCSII